MHELTFVNQVTIWINEAVVTDARRKANDEDVSYFFTWNVNRLVI